LLAHLYLTTGRPEQALAELSPVLERCESRDIPGLILREGAPMGPLLRLVANQGIRPAFAARLLDLLGEPLGEPAPPSAVRVPWPGAPLAAREVELLGLVATGASNRRIAEQLSIGVATVKTHLIHIFQKLDVASRTEAAARARELRLA